ncbi:hypothetical protein, partial [Mycobacterium sp. NAZ190054]|uniref:hypothetical protein n=1 Tax=Mycobacterium sp. NAZ190054 TaxID=1747766 RepID=UPI000A9758A2
SVSHLIEVPYVLPFLAESKLSGVTLQGVEDLQREAEQKFGPGTGSLTQFAAARPSCCPGTSRSAG